MFIFIYIYKYICIYIYIYNFTIYIYLQIYLYIYIYVYHELRTPFDEVAKHWPVTMEEREMIQEYLWESLWFWLRRSAGKKEWDWRPGLGSGGNRLSMKPTCINIEWFVCFWWDLFNFRCCWFLPGFCLFNVRRIYQQRWN